ncbi:hypothetical protein F4Z99_17430 [Candidatus Poribacteria bacterium]|nr:hypothetical protein [Candidatus Poribacteria bacterium]
MWEIKLVQAYYDLEGLWAGLGTPVSLNSKFGDTEAVLTEVREFLKSQGDNEALEIEPKQVDELWELARKDPRCDQELALRTDDYKSESPHDEEFEGVVQIQLWVSYNIEKAQEKVAAPAPEPKSEQLELF